MEQPSDVKEVLVVCAGFVCGLHDSIGILAVRLRAATLSFVGRLISGRFSVLTIILNIAMEVVNKCAKINASKR